MSDRLFSKIYDTINKHKITTIIATSIILIASVVGLFFIPFNNNVELMLPADEEFSQSLQFLRESKFSDKVVLSLGLKSTDKNTQDLIAAARSLKQNLKLPYVQQIDEGIFETNILNEMKGFLSYVPQIITESDLSDIKNKIHPREIELQLGKGYNRMLSPHSVLAGYFLQNDPLSIKLEYLKSIQNLMKSIGYQAKIQDGHFVSNDGRHVMLILSTHILITDSSGSRKLINYLQKQLEFLPNYVHVDIISGHLHTLSNEDILKKDIAKTVFVISIVLLILLCVVFRDFRALIVFIVPVIAILISLNLTSLTIGKLSSFVVGMAAVIAGITVDYGIHIFLAVQSGGVEKVKQIAKPVFVCVLTTMGVFSSFFFSTIDGYKQFALLTNFSILLSVFFYLFLLSRFLAKDSSHPIDNPFPIAIPKGKSENKIMIFSWLILLVIMVVAANRLEFGTDMRAYDGSSEAIFEAEERFHEIWGLEREPAIFVASSDRLEKALKINENIYEKAIESFGENDFSSIAKIYPSMETRTKNLARWKSFWKTGQESTLKKLLYKYGASFKFAENAFDPFFNSLYDSSVSEFSSENTQLLDRVKDRFVQKTQNGYYVMSFFPDEKEFIKKARKISDPIKNTFIISRNSMAESISLSVYNEVTKLAWIAVTLIILLALILLKNIRLTILALLPVATSVCMILGMLSVLGFSLNAPSLIATLVVIGLCIDYGVFMVYDCKYHLKAGTSLAISLSAITTIMGGGVLLLAKHPVLFYVGLTMTIGILSGYLVAVLIIPPCYQLWIQDE